MRFCHSEEREGKIHVLYSLFRVSKQPPSGVATACDRQWFREDLARRTGSRRVGCAPQSPPSVCPPVCDGHSGCGLSRARCREPCAGDC